MGNLVFFPFLAATLCVHNNWHVNRKKQGRGQYAMQGQRRLMRTQAATSSTCLQSGTATGSLQHRCMLPAPPRTSRDPSHTPTTSPDLMPKPTAACRSPGSGCQRVSTRLFEGGAARRGGRKLEGLVVQD